MCKCNDVDEELRLCNKCKVQTLHWIPVGVVIVLSVVSFIVGAILEGKTQVAFLAIGGSLAFSALVNAGVVLMKSRCIHGMCGVYGILHMAGAIASCILMIKEESKKGNTAGVVVNSLIIPVSLIITPPILFLHFKSALSSRPTAGREMEGNWEENVDLFDTEK